MNRRQMIAAGTVAAAAVPLAGMARAQESAMMADGTMDPAKAPAILNGTFSKLSSQLAVEKATDEAVRTFAELEVAEQTAVAMAFGVPADAPAAIPEDKAAMLEMLQAAEGAEFDMMYVEGQIERLQQVFEIIGKRAQGKTCAAMDGITEEAAEILEEYKDSPALDAGILAAAQAVEHYEITRYGTLAAWADQLGHADAASLLRETLAEEVKTDELLTQLAESAVNAAAERPAA